MLDPGFWTDARIKRLEPIERLFFLGCVSAADDEGRLMADLAFLRSRIFPYDEITTEQIEAVRDRVAEIVPGFVLYSVDGEKYVAFRNWSDYQKPSHAKPSDLPPPPFAPVSCARDEPGPRDSCGVPSQVRLGKDSTGKDSIGKVEEKQPPLFSVVFEQITGTAIAGHDQAEEINAWMEDVSEDWFRGACKEAADNNKRSWSYVRAILQNWKAGGKHAKRGKGRSGDEDPDGFDQTVKDRAARREPEASGAPD